VDEKLEGSFAQRWKGETIVRRYVVNKRHVAEKKLDIIFRD
jgi:hypothetical protein